MKGGCSNGPGGLIFFFFFFFGGGGGGGLGGNYQKKSRILYSILNTSDLSFSYFIAFKYLAER